MCSIYTARRNPPPAPVQQEKTEPPAQAEPTEAIEPTEAVMPELVGDSLRGGQLYDKWWSVLGVDAPTSDHPLWATQSSNTRSGADTWRCKECHGWDYKGVEGAYGSGSHKTGFIGVYQLAGTDPNVVLAALKGATNPDHDFSQVMDEQALIDLALFISQELVDDTVFINYDDKSAVSTDVTTGDDLFQESCADCHGFEGTAINFSDEGGPEYVGTLATDNPWEFMHKARFGQPGEPDMPQGLDIGWTVDEQAAVLAFAQTLPTSSPVTEGGRLYDKWWEALGMDEPSGDQPLWATQTTNTRSGADTWRCKECHGWDYKGVEGAYGSGSHMTGFVGVYGAKDMSAEEIVAWLDGTNNPDHDFSQYFGEEQMAMFVAFLQQLPDVSMYINADKSVNGDAAKGQELYQEGCSRCHGDDGKQIKFGDEAEPEYVGTIANDNPWEFFHKASYGQPGEHMPSGINFGWSLQDIADLLTFAQSLEQ